MATRAKVTKEEPVVVSTPATDIEGRKKALKIAMDNIRKDHGEGSIMTMGKGPIPKIPVSSTGISSLDKALGVGGLPRGRVVEIYGPEGSGKTTMCLEFVAEAQRNGGTCAFVDAEHALDMQMASNIGVDTENLLLSQPDCGEQALEIVEELVSSGAVDIIVVDSVAALTPRSEIEGDMGDAQMGVQARLMSQALRKLTSVVSKTKTIVIFVNQLRMKIGVMFGNPETTTGGNALKFYSSIRMDVRRIETLKDGNEVTGNRVRVKVVKNKVAPPFKETELDIVFGWGVDKVADAVDMAVAADIVQKSGSWYSFKDEKLGQGLPAAVEALKEKPELLLEIKSLLGAK